MSDILNEKEKRVLEQTGIIHKSFTTSEEDFVGELKDDEVVLQYNVHKYWIVQDDGTQVVKNLSKTSKDFTPHIDGIDLPVTPRYVALYCVSSGVSDVETYLIDTKKFLDSLDESEIGILKKLKFVFVDKAGGEYETPVIRYNEDGGYYLHLTGRGYFKPEYTYNEKYKENMEFYEYLPVVNKLSAYLGSKENWDFSLILKKDDLLVFDNQRYIHGRCKPQVEVRDFERRVVRVYFNENITNK